MCLVFMIIQITRFGHMVTNKKTGNQFLDFVNRVDQKYDDSIKQIFLVLDNVSIHKSNKVKQTIAKCHPRIQLVFLPTRGLLN